MFERLLLAMYLFAVLLGAEVQTIQAKGHHLTQSDGKSFLWFADTAWELFHFLSKEDASFYLQRRAEQGFTVVMASAFSEFSGRNEPNFYGQRPFLKEGNPLSQNEDYYRHVDWVVDQAAKHGLYVGLLPAWGDKVFTRPGNKNSILNASNARAYGKWFGNRYRGRKNIVWILGGDRNGTGFEPVWREMAAGIRSADATHLMTWHPNGRWSSSTWFHNDSWLSFNMIQSGHNLKNNPVHEMIRADFQRLPVKPVLDGEPAYETHPVDWKPEEKGRFDALDVRKHAYWAVLAGAAGHTYGAHGIWQFRDPALRPGIGAAIDQTWREQLELPGAQQLMHLKRLLEQRPIADRIPDQGMLASGQGFGDEYIAIARGKNYVYAYSSNGRSFTLRLDRIGGGKLQGWWFDPRTGQKDSSIGEVVPDGLKEFQPPGPRDWLLVLERLP